MTKRICAGKQGKYVKGPILDAQRCTRPPASLPSQPGGVFMGTAGASA